MLWNTGVSPKTSWCVTFWHACHRFTITALSRGCTQAKWRDNLGPFLVERLVQINVAPCCGIWSSGLGFGICLWTHPSPVPALPSPTRLPCWQTHDNPMIHPFGSLLAPQWFCLPLENVLQLLSTLLEYTFHQRAAPIGLVCTYVRFITGFHLIWQIILSFKFKLLERQHDLGLFSLTELNFSCNLKPKLQTLLKKAAFKNNLRY